MYFIFLGIDGVLNTTSSKSWIEKPLVKNLSFLKGSIVLTSSWKTEWDFGKPKGRMKEFNRILWACGLSIADKIDEGDRPMMISKYLSEHPWNGYVILDDEWWDGYEKHTHHLVQINPKEGLTFEKVLFANSLLQKEIF